MMIVVEPQGDSDSDIFHLTAQQDMEQLKNTNI
jgi:hypothetical protein